MGSIKNLTEKQEKFVAEYLINGGNATKAYRTAYNAKNMSEKQINEEACRLKKHPKITPRIKEHQEEVKQEFNYTLQESFKNLEEMRKLAMSYDNGKVNLTAAIRAEELKGKLAGFYVDKTKNENINTEISYNEWVKNIPDEGY